jgi:ribosomal protein S18 acetylase RimI-like enzyme
MEKINILYKELDTEILDCRFSDIFELSNDFFYEYQNHNNDFFRISTINENDINNYFRSFIGNENKKAFVALNEDKIIGYITFYIKYQPNFYIIEKVGCISGLMVSKKFRNNGIGTELVKKSLEYFQNMNVKYYEVFTSVNNIKGISLYKKNGFKELYATLYGEIN